MAIKNGDFVRINFTGKEKENEEIIDTTYEEIAIEADIFNDKKEYKPIPIVVGGNHLLPRIEESIVGLDVGDNITVEIASEDAFGPRNPSAVQLIPMKEFKKQGMTPYPGMRISSGGGEGRILTVNGGRVKVDFNHPLAGKDVVYDVEVIEIIEDTDEKIKSMIELHYSNPNADIDNTVIEINDGVLDIQLDDVCKYDQQSYMDITLARFKIARDIWNNIDEIEKVNFIDSFEKKIMEEESDESDNDGSADASEEINNEEE